MEQVSVTPSDITGITESLNATETLNYGALQANSEEKSLNLRDISVLRSYVRLQKLELPHNNIKDVSCLSHMPQLVILDVSHNEISNFFEFQPLKCLQVANFSHNHIPDIKDLKGFSCLRKLDLDYNCLSEIGGLEQCSMLSHLSLAHNKITKISRLARLPLTHLCLRGNQLKGAEGLENLQSLQVLDLSMNHISTLSGLQNLRFLCSLNLEKNQISKVPDLNPVVGLPLLMNINLLGNPVQEQPDYRQTVIFLHQHLTVLDQEPVSVKEKVSSVNIFDPPMDLLAAIDHMTHLVYQMGQPQVLYHSTPPTADVPYPMLVLTGPEGCGKEELVHRLCQEFGEYFGVGIRHTTRKANVGEENGIDYHFVSEEDFQNLVRMGKFVQTTQHGGHLFGLTRDAIEDVAEEGLVCCVHMELEGVFSLKKSCFEPRYILLMPTRVEKFVSHLKRLKLYTPAQIELAVQRVALYSNTCEQRPRFFDDIIPCDDCEEAYQTLQRVVKDYLLAQEEEGKASSGLSSDSSFTAENPPPPPPSGSRSETLMSRPGSDSSFMPRVPNIQAELSSSKLPTELASVMRREQQAREAVVGKRPGLYSQLSKRYKSAQKPSSLQHHQDPGAHFQEDSSSDESRLSSFLSVPSPAGGLVKPRDGSILVQSSGMLEDRNLGFKAESVLPPILTGHKTRDVCRSPQSQRAQPTSPDEKNKGANVKEAFS